LLELKARVRLTHVVHRDNYAHCEEFVDFAHKHLRGIDRIQFSYVKAAGRAVEFVDSAFDETDLRARVGALVPEARDLTVAPMSLRDIFIALARMFRLAER